MTVHVHKLEGCTPSPLSGYLKALAVLRLISSQRDPTARGWWRDEVFWLATELSRDELVQFFLEEYEPTPILSPWNGGSGFYYDADPGLTPIETSPAPRFERFRFGISAARAMCAPLQQAIVALKAADEAAKAAGKKDAAAAAALKQAKATKDRLKDALLAACRRSWDGGLLDWFDAALALDGEGAASWPALLGSGGNDGRLDFTNNSMQHLATLFDCADPRGRARPAAVPLLKASLFSGAAPGLLSKAVGQFLPGSAGGDNMGSGFSGASQVNPWDFVLTLEGTVVLASSIVRSSDVAELPQAAAPFAVRPSASGYGSASSADEGPRGEQWMPLWSQAASHGEVRRLFAEGRTRTGRGTSVRALDSARAVARLGAARGVSQFERYGYIERNGQANLAVPLGRWRVGAQPNAELLDDVDSWVGRLRGFARDKLAPKAITSAVRVVDEAILAACKAGGDPQRWQGLLVALGNAEAALLRSPSKAGDSKRGLSPLPVLSAAWLKAIDDGSREVRLAIALASQDAALRYGGHQIVSNVRAHWMPLDRAGAPQHSHARRRPARFAADASGLANDVDVVCSTDDLERDCIALIRRRVQLAPTLSSRGLGLVGARNAEARLADVMAFLWGQVDDARILALARPLMAIEWWSDARPEFASPAHQGIDAAYAIARLTHLSEPLDIGVKLTIPLDAEPIARLAAGDLQGAMAVCLRRLRASGLSPVIRSVADSPRYARRLAASLAFPLRRVDVSRCAAFVTKPYDQQESAHGD